MGFMQLGKSNLGGRCVLCVNLLDNSKGDVCPNSLRYPYWKIE